MLAKAAFTFPHPPFPSFLLVSPLGWSFLRVPAPRSLMWNAQMSGSFCGSDCIWSFSTKLLFIPPPLQLSFHLRLTHGQSVCPACRSHPSPGGAPSFTFLSADNLCNNANVLWTFRECSLVGKSEASRCRPTKVQHGCCLDNRESICHKLFVYSPGDSFIIKYTKFCRTSIHSHIPLLSNSINCMYVFVQRVVIDLHC